VPYLFITVIAIAIAAFASLKFTLSLFACIALVTIIVKLTAEKFVGPVSLGAAARAAMWACVLPALLTLALLLMNNGKLEVDGLAAIVFLSALFASFALGFKLSLDATFSASATIAAVSTLVAGGMLYLLKPLLF
jgi:hypothetical protein